MNFFSTDISMHLRKRSVEGALCVEIGVYADISCEAKCHCRIKYEVIFGIPLAYSMPISLHSGVYLCKNKQREGEEEDSLENL